MNKVMTRIKEFCNRHFKHHCPDCDGIMDSDVFNMELDRVVYKCRNCGKEWC